MSRTGQHSHRQIQRPLPGLDLGNGLEKAAELLAPHRLPTNTTTRTHPIHRWFNFIAGFSPEFVTNCVTEARLTSRDHLLDPFAGCATAPVVACQLGMKATGFEPHPVFSRIGRAKLPPADLHQHILSIKNCIQKGLDCPIPPEGLPEAPRIFLGKLFSPETLSSLLGAKRALKQHGLASSDTAFLMLSRIVDKSTHSQTDGIYKAPTSTKRAHSPAAVCEETAAMLLDDLVATNHPNFSDRCTIHQHSSESMTEVEDGSVSIVVTSPPYLNNFDYAEMTRMLLYFWGIAESWGEITDRVRKHLIVNTTTALKGHKPRQHEYRSQLPTEVLAELDSLVAELRERRKSRAGKKEYDLLVYPYFSQMLSVLQECRRCLKRGGRMHLMVADAALYGVHISTPQVLAHMMSTMGFKDVKCEQVRKRGHRWVLTKREGSPTGLGEYHISAIR